MKLLIISASQRKSSQSARVARYIKAVAANFEQVHHIDLCQYSLPYWDGEQESKYAKGSGWPMIEKKVDSADALVLITPEWGGMATPLLKNFLLMCDGQQTAHKPALLVSVVSGISGAYPIAELRMNALKNNKIVAVPDHLIIRQVEQRLHASYGVAQPATNGDDLQFSPKEQNLRSRIDYCLHMLHQYAQALFTVRENHKDKPYPKQQEYSYGM